MDIHSETEMWRRLAKLETYVFGATDEERQKMITAEIEHRELVEEFEADLKLRTKRFAALAEALDKEEAP